MRSGEADITVFEHDTLRIKESEKDSKFTPEVLAALQQHYGQKGVPYFSLIHNGVRFNEYVGVIQAGNTLIEVLPKADKTKHSVEEEKKWRYTLIGMLKAVGLFDVKSSGQSQLRLKTNHILDLYFELFLIEAEYLLHTGLIKRYRRTEGNLTALKGSLQFSKHISQNIIHKERFYVQYSTYDREHELHQIIYKTIKLIDQLNTNSQLTGRIGGLKLNFPEMPDLKVSQNTFSRITYDRKSKPYQTAMEIAELLLLNYHPDVSKGNKNVLALMFDMNLLWESFVLKSLKRYGKGMKSIEGQQIKYFWRPEKGSRSYMKPDIVINANREDCVILDTKWKNLYGSNPSPEDLRQMYVYLKYFKSKKVALVYPGLRDKPVAGNYLSPKDGTTEKKECAIIEVDVLPDIKAWQEDLANKIVTWIDLKRSQPKVPKG